MKKIGLICLAIVLALAGLGFAYAHWDDQLHINADVEAGSCTLAWDAEEILDYIDIEEATGDKDVGWGEIYYDLDSRVDDPHSGKWGYKKLELVVHDAYPSYEIHFTTIVVHNIGTLPVHITGFDIYDPTDPPELNFEWTAPPPASPAEGFFWKDFDGDGVLDPDEEEIINVVIKDFVCIQLEPCGSTKGEIDLHFKQPMEECHTYHFEVEIEGVQWNKAP